MKKLFLILALGLITNLVISQNKLSYDIEFSETTLEVKDSSYNSIEYVVEGLSSDQINKAWKRKMKLNGGKIDKWSLIKSYTAAKEVRIPEISEKELQVIMKTIKVDADHQRVSQIFLFPNGESLSSEKNPVEYAKVMAYFKELQKEFNIQENKVAVEDLTKGHEKLIKNKKKVQKDSKKKAKSINKAKTGIKSMERGIVKLEDQIKLAEEKSDLISEKLTKIRMADIPDDGEIIKDVTKEQKANKKEIKKLKSKIKSNEKKIRNYETDILNYETDIKENERKIDEINNQIGEQADKINEERIRGEKIKQQKI